MFWNTVSPTSLQARGLACPTTPWKSAPPADGAGRAHVPRRAVPSKERDEQGRVIAGVSADQLATLRVGLAVTLYDPVDRLWADATVAWIEADARAIGFDVDWTSFEDGDLPKVEPLGGVAATSQLMPRISVVLEPARWTGPARQPRVSARPRLEMAAADTGTGGSSYPLWHTVLSFLARMRLRHAHEPLMRAYSILPVSREQERAVSPSGVTDLRTGWELQP